MSDLTIKIRKIRIILEFSQEYVAACLNITQRAYSNVENGKTRIHYERIRQIAKVFGVSTADLLEKSLDELTTQVLSRVNR